MLKPPLKTVRGRLSRTSGSVPVSLRRKDLPLVFGLSFGRLVLPVSNDEGLGVSRH